MTGTDYYYILTHKLLSYIDSQSTEIKVCQAHKNLNENEWII